MATISATVTIEDPIGFRMGRVGDNLVKANSPLSLMSLKGKTGEQLSVEVDTDDEAKGHEIIVSIQQFLKG
jgi:phosphotransferase system HPr-like phosphotransfer protein